MGAGGEVRLSDPIAAHLPADLLVAIFYGGLGIFLEEVAEDLV